MVNCYCQNKAEAVIDVTFSSGNKERIKTSFPPLCVDCTNTTEKVGLKIAGDQNNNGSREYIEPVYRADGSSNDDFFVKLEFVGTNQGGNVYWVDVYKNKVKIFRAYNQSFNANLSVTASIHFDHDLSSSATNNLFLFKLTDSNGTIYSKELLECPIYLVACDDECPTGYCKCECTNYPGYCCYDSTGYPLR